MQFGLSQEQVLLQDSINKFLSDAAPLAAVRKVAAGDTDDREIWRGLTELGVPGLMIPEAQGGVGLKCLDAVVAAECLGYHVTPGPFIASAVMAPIPLIAAERYDVLAGIATGERRVGIAFGEAVGARNDAGVTAKRTRLTGKCLFVLDADADDYIVATAATGRSGKRKLFLVSATAEGVTRRKLTTVDKTRTTAELELANVAAKLLTDDEDTYLRTLDAGRIMQAADSLGAAQCMIDQAVAYAKQRTQFNRVIASFQAVKHMCAEMAANLEPCRSLVWYAAHAFDEVPEDARVTACHAKAHVSEVGKFVAKTATEVHGGMGFTDLVGLHYWFKRIGANRQLLGSPELVREEAARIQGLAA